MTFVFIYIYWMYWCEFFLPRRLLWLCFDMLTIVCVLVKANFMANNNRSDYTHIQKHTSIYIYTHTHIHIATETCRNERKCFNNIFYGLLRSVHAYITIIIIIIYISKLPIRDNWMFFFFPITLSCPKLYNIHKILCANGDMQYCAMGINDEIHLPKYVYGEKLLVSRAPFSFFVPLKNCGYCKWKSIFMR